MVQLFVRLVAAPDRTLEILNALRTVMRPAKHSRGCHCAEIHRDALDEREITYIEEWDDAEELHRQFGTKRFTNLLELLEMAAECPTVEFRIVSETHGLEYLTSGRDAIEEREHGRNEG